MAIVHLFHDGMSRLLPEPNSCVLAVILFNMLLDMLTDALKFLRVHWKKIDTFNDFLFADDCAFITALEAAMQYCAYKFSDPATSITKNLWT
jgi:hypothetical protein